MANLNNSKDTDLSVKFNRAEKPKKALLPLLVLAWILSFPTLWRRRHRLVKYNMKGIKPPYILLCNHNSFIDFKAQKKAIFPHSAINIVALDGFIKRERLLRYVGCIGKRKFTNDPLLVRHMLYALRKLNKIVAIYPEARYSLIGTQSILPESLAKFIKIASVPVVILKTHGHHIDSPVWNIDVRKIKIEAEMTLILNEKETKTKSIDQIHQKVSDMFAYDDYLWQQKHNIKIDYNQRAKGLQKVLYQCPSCKVEFQMDSTGNHLTCLACQKQYHIDGYNQIKAVDGTTEFTHIPAWFAWQKEEVRKEVASKNYRIEDEVIVDALPNSKGFIALGDGRLRHDSDGFKLTYKEQATVKTMHKEVLSMIGVHVEFDYNNQGDCISFSTLDDTFYMYFKHLKNVVTKIHFATEILYELATEKQKADA